MNKKKYTALFLLRKKDKFCKKFFKIVSADCKSSKVLWIGNDERFTLYKKVKKKYDYIFSYRSSIILTKKDISLANIAAINLHPGPPKYRGIGCLNYALYNKEKKYGFTIHLISKKIDFGKILFVKYFPISKNSNVSSLLYKTHKQCVKYSKFFFKNILSNQKKINFYKNKFKKAKWSKIIRNREDLNSFYRIKNFNLRDVNNKIRATNYKNFRPFIQIGSNKFLFETK
tara:strand:- start:19444 stop:20130 length:687 start_codon:yes stop_codon:yes gene_type:complete